MRQRTIRLRRARCLFAYWQNGQLCFHNFATRRTVSGKPITCELLAFFDRWRTSQEAVKHFAEYTQRSVRSTLAQLVKLGLLLRNDSPERKRDGRIANEWSAWLPQGSFHFCTKDAIYVDRSNWSSDRLKAILPKTPQPKLFKIVKGAAKTALPSRVFPDSEFVRVLMSRKTHRQFSKQQLPLETVSQLLSLVWGVNGYLYSRRFGKLLHKTSPSAGARHPGEVYLMALRVKGLKAGLYHYQPATHQLETISTKTSREEGMAVLRPATLREKRSCFIFNDGCVSAHDVEVSARSGLSRGASRCWTSVPNFLSGGHLARAGAILHSGAQGHTDREGPRNRRNSRVSALCSGSWFSHYFGASEATIFSKRASPRSESQSG